MNKVHKLNLKLIKPRNKRDNIKFYTCDSCGKKYHQDLMISYLPTNYGYYKDDSTHHCIRCYNGKF
jgi:hypothetical protein